MARVALEQRNHLPLATILQGEYFKGEKMNSWQIIKQELNKDNKPNSLGSAIALKQCAQLLTSLKGKLTDYDDAVQNMNQDTELREALLNNNHVEMLRKEGVI